ncbi:4'-phosphopantetheinyl transferase family protein [Streptomyces griseiscabiei]|uniref:4'-phosphopantetheinyl transferase superfamily protein n=1 Tax=Streptomyces griseiscabiei TaxID=2993540 RepID=A0ABU4L6P7_9ACTN|nr:4'-phosphopantetheinyl transferase superfamily protein [Streptomyces griseiscabiei]MBZ3906468.1 4'-phosphopantetheinyl transferase superfamily protein [Streptomyces griseiscabiei]MDX2911464.1 4'-phosphopantetheinyl transferase superfamily protein [Streptomyces griseiscabiei]
MIDQLLPATVASAWAREDLPDTRLFPEEEAALGDAVDKRRREYTTVRACARRAFTRLGMEPAPVVPGHRGAPRWPDGLVGSMTHCAGYRAAALARASDAFALGIDAEPHQPLPEGVLDVVARPEERSWIAGRGGGAGVWWDRLMFGAKEAVFKVWYPLTGRELDFDEAVVDFRPRDVAPGHASGAFDARLLVPGPRTLTELSGRWLVRDGLSVTAIVLPARPPGHG